MGSSSPIMGTTSGQVSDGINQGILKWESGLFLTPVLTLWGGGHIVCTEASYCTFCFDAIICHDLRISSLPHDSPSDNLYACMS